MNYRFEDCCVPVEGTIVDAMRSLEVSGVEIVLVINNSAKLEGVMTGGDIRRALLRGALLDSPIGPFVQRKFVAVAPRVGRAEVLDVMRARTIDQIPIIDSHGRLVGLHLLHELIGAVERPNCALIMAGGKGSRLWPLTEHLPKPMIKVAGRPILERLVLHLVSHGIRRVYLSINYLGHIIEEHFSDGSTFGCKIDYLREEVSLGSGGAISLLPTPTLPIVVLNGDLVTQVDLGAMLDFHARGNYVATMGVREHAIELPFGRVGIADGRMRQIEEKPVDRCQINIGIYVLNPEVVKRVPAKQTFPITKLFQDCLQRNEPVGAYQTEDDWIDVGQREELSAARGVRK